MSEAVAKQSEKTGVNRGYKNPEVGWMIGFLFVVSFLGLFSVVPLRKVLSSSSPFNKLHQKTKETQLNFNLIHIYHLVGLIRS